jgi:hypothetical protein
MLTRLLSSLCVPALTFEPGFFLISVGGLWVLRPLTGLLYQPRTIGDGDCGEIGKMKIGRGNRRTRRKLAPVPLCPQQISYD